MTQQKFSPEFLARLKESDIGENNVEYFTKYGKTKYVAIFRMPYKGLIYEITYTKESVSELEEAILNILKK